jgi:glycosyltransferase involved in cell wall biosynthesis
MKVLVLSQHFWPEVFRINDVVLSLRDAGAEVTVLTGKPNYPGGSIFPGYRALGTHKESYHGVDVYRVPLIPRGRGSAVRLALNYLSFLASASLIGPWLLQRQRFDVVFVYGTSPILQAFPAVVLKWLKRCPMVLWVQDLWPESLAATGYVRNKAALGLIGWIVRGIYALSDLILVQSRAFLPPVSAMAKGRPLSYHPNPGERDGSGAPEPSGEAPLRFRPGFNVVFAGNLGTAQALDTLVEAAALLTDCPEIRFILVGSGSRSEWIRGEVARRCLRNVELPGRFPAEAMPSILAGASVLLVSLARREILAATIPSKIQTYLATGRPILAAMDGEGARVISEAGAGICTPAEDAPALAAAVRYLAGLPQEALAAMGQRGREYYTAHFAPEKLAGVLMEMLRGAAMERRTVQSNDGSGL